MLEQLVPAHFALGTPQELAEAFHLGRIPMRRVLELAPIVLAEAAADGSGDLVAAEIVDRLAAEVVAFARVALTRLGLTDGPVEVLLGGGIMRAANGRLQAAIANGLQTVSPDVVARVVPEPPIVGAALLGLDDLGAPPEARARSRRELWEAVRAGDELATTGSTSHG